MISDVRQLATDLRQLDQHVIADLAYFDKRNLSVALKHAQELLKGPKKRDIPSQQERDDEWHNYAFGDAQLNGWPSFVTRSIKMDKSIGEKIIEEVLMRESVQREDGKYVFADTGDEMSLEYARWYSKMLKDNGYALYMEFSELYNKITGFPIRRPLRIVRKTFAQVQEEKAERVAKEKAEEEKKEAAKKALKAEKERLKAEEKAAIEARNKEIDERFMQKWKREEKEKALSCVKRMKAPLEKAEEEKKEAAPVVKLKKKVIPSPVPAVRPEVDPFVVEKDNLKQWKWNGIVYARDAENYVWAWNEEADDIGAFQGKYNYKLDKMEECEEPEFDD